ncbi:YqaJ viral recombinase family protein [Leifsonia sp. TF02-11]|uniref:YqaJ viral recombinase family protein n=1 Tax=Leifsonia sp. TF02-11 TaxID=2815212 RepID=UPI001AA0D0D2|nr:YqaJ viral recombinase family protein [Leifsonia sp. TF02-11]MBO1739700.1 hypothetical protein [Leifsonia sp. TF02-11]
MTYLDRILDDGTVRERWQEARWPVIGASDAAKLSKASSIPSYLRAKLSRESFHGNSYTASGHRWEPMMLAWAGIPQNVALFHSPQETGFAATPDGILRLADDRLLLAECKAKHGRIVNGPSLPEWRQLAWQFLVFPEADEIEFLWVEVIDGEMRTTEPKHLTVRRDDPKIVDLTAQILPIATELLAQLRLALEFERNIA